MNGIHVTTHADPSVNVAAPQLALALITPATVGPIKKPHE